LSIAPQNLYKIKAGTANVTIQILVDLFNNYNINPSFFFTDKTPMFMGEVKHYDADGGEVLVLREEKIKGYDQEVENLKEHLNEYKLLVSLLKEKINLKDE
jgi:hypothetical protein